MHWQNLNLLLGKTILTKNAFLPEKDEEKSPEQVKMDSHCSVEPALKYLLLEEMQSR